MLLGKKTIGTIGYMGGIMTLPEPFVWSWTQMIQYNSEYMVEPNETVNYIKAGVSYHSFARNSMVKNMRGDWLLMMDTDHQFEPDIAQRMLSMMEKHKIDVLVAPYVFKGHPHAPVLYTWDEKTEQFSMLGKWEGKAELFEIGSAGAGCLMVRKDVFKRIHDELDEEPFDIIPPYSEDHSFFRRLKKLGIKAYFAPSIETHHLTFKSLSLEDFDTTGTTFGEMKQVDGLG